MSRFYYCPYNGDPCTGHCSTLHCERGLAPEPRNPRYVLEGEWTGYVARQRRCVHREIIKNKKLVDWVNSNRAIQYTDGTSLLLTVRMLKPRERVQMINGYGSLIRSCFNRNVNSVAALKCEQVPA